MGTSVRPQYRLSRIPSFSIISGLGFQHCARKATWFGTSFAEGIVGIDPLHLTHQQYHLTYAISTQSMVCFRVDLIFRVQDITGPIAPKNSAPAVWMPSGDCFTWFTTGCRISSSCVSRRRSDTPSKDIWWSRIPAVIMSATLERTSCCEQWRTSDERMVG